MDRALSLETKISILPVIPLPHVDLEKVTWRAYFMFLSFELLRLLNQNHSATMSQSCPEVYVILYI